MLSERQIIEITDHAYDRGKERMSLGAKPFKKIAHSAFLKGIKHVDTVGGLKKYISSLYLQYESANNIRIYGENIFFFRKNRLITVYNLPVEFKKYIKICKQKKIR